MDTKSNKNQFKNNTKMIKLEELSKIRQRKFEIDEAEKLRFEKELKDKFEKQYTDIISNLEDKLIKAASDGKKHMSVAHFSAFGFNMSAELHKKRGSYGNYYVAWNKIIFPEDVVKYMQGNLKRVYDYLKENNLNPQIEYWTDGGGQDEGFELVVKW